MFGIQVELPVGEVYARIIMLHHDYARHLKEVLQEAFRNARKNLGMKELYFNPREAGDLVPVNYKGKPREVHCF